MAIEVGKDVVAIIDHAGGQFKKGQIFKCLSIKTANCNCIPLLIDVGIRTHATLSQCLLCGNITDDKSPVWWFKITSFRAIDDITPSIEEIIKEIAPLKLINH